MGVGTRFPTSLILVGSRGSPWREHVPNLSDIAGITCLQSAHFLKIMWYFNHAQLDYKGNSKHLFSRSKQAMLTTSMESDAQAPYISSTLRVALTGLSTRLVCERCKMRWAIGCWQACATLQNPELDLSTCCALGRGCSHVQCSQL